MQFRINTFLSPLCCSLALFAACTLQAQDRAFSIGLHAGSVLATVKSDPDDALDAKFRACFFAGANLRWALSDQWAVPVDVQFSRRGFQYETPGSYIVQNGQLALYRGRIDFRLGYIDVQPQIEFRPIAALGIAAGHYLSYRVAESVKYGDVIDWTSTKDDELYNATDFGLAAKLTGDIGPVYLFAAFQFGLSNISNITLTDENGQEVGDLGLKNRAVFLGAGWRF